MVEAWGVLHYDGKLDIRSVSESRGGAIANYILANVRDIEVRTHIIRLGNDDDGLELFWIGFLEEVQKEKHNVDLVKLNITIVSN